MSLGPFDFVGGARTAQLAVELAASSAALTVTGDNLDGWPDGSDGLFPFTLNRGEDNEERILGESRSGNVITVYDDDENGRGWDDTSISLHQVGATLEHTIAGRVEKENSAHVYQTDGAHGADGDVVGQNTLDTAVTDLEALIDSQIALLAITKAFIAAKGDLIVGSADDTPAILPVGTTGQFPRVSAGTLVYDDADWADALPASGYQSVSGVTEVYWDGLTDDSYEIHGEIIGSGSLELRARLRIDAVDVSAADYYWYYTLFQVGSENPNGASGGGYIQVAQMTTDGAIFDLDIADIGAAAATRLDSHGSALTTNIGLFRGAGRLAPASPVAHNGIKLYVPTGTMSGKFWLKRRRKAFTE